MEKYEKLIILRKITKLNLFDTLRVYRACKKADDLRSLLAKCDSTHAYSTDYSEALELEFKLRMNTLKSCLYDEWMKYISVEQDGFTLEQYALRCLDDYKNDDIVRKHN